VWLAPSSRAAAAIRDELAAKADSTILTPGVMTFDDLARKVVAASGVKTRLVSSSIRRDLLRRVVAKSVAANELELFAEAAGQTGFVDLLVEHIRELKRRDVRPSDYSRTASKLRQPRLRELAKLYAAYETLLAEHGLWDDERLFYSARDVLAQRDFRMYSNLDLVVADGFNDFTRVQFELLLALVARSAKVVVSLPIDPRGDGERTELFAKTEATLELFERQFPQLEVRRLGERQPTNAAIGHLVRNVFRYPQPAPEAEVDKALDSIEIVEAASAHDEIAQLARRIKTRLVNSDAKPADIVVVLRSLGDAAPRISEVFSQFGIPFSLETSKRLAAAPLLSTLTRVLQLDAADWPFRGLVALVTNNAITSIPAESRASIDWLIRDLQIAKGRQKLFAAFESLAQQENIDQQSEHHQRQTLAAKKALPPLSYVAAALDRLPESASLTEWGTALATLGSELGLSPFVELGANTPSSLSDAAAWEAIVSHFAAFEKLDAWLGEQPRKFDRRQIIDMLRDLASHERLPRTHDDAGCVRILSAQTARTIFAPHLYLAGMSEQAFPEATSAGQLATDSDYRQLSRAAMKTSSKEVTGSDPSRSQDEMLLFYEVLSRAGETLTISYPAMDDKAQVLPPSPYVLELRRMFRKCERQLPTTPPQLSPVARCSFKHAAEFAKNSAGGGNNLNSGESSYADWRVAAIADAVRRDGDRRLLAGLFSYELTKSVAASIESGVRIVHDRAHGEAFTPSEGLLTSPAVIERLGKRFGTDHSWSPSQFETYAACPYKFFLHSVLRLEPLGELMLETDFARRGSLLHQVLAAFHRKYSDSEEGGWSALWNDQPRFVAELRQALARAIGNAPPEGIEAALRELDRRQIDKWADLYHGHHKRYDDTWDKYNFEERPQPTHFELRFGRKHSGEADDEDADSTDKVFELEIAKGEWIKIAGRIDRIDVGRVGGQTVFNVIDYKSGRRPTLTMDKIESGERLQPALYVMAAQAVLFANGQAVPMWAGYWSMHGGVTTRKDYSLHCSVESGKATEIWENLKPKVISRIAEIVRAARRGDFPIASSDLHCTSMCDFKTVCRVAQVRNAKKIWSGNVEAPGKDNQPPGLPGV
jgi:ATP-dependent helicase/nuclease subunit B